MDNQVPSNITKLLRSGALQLGILLLLLLALPLLLVQTTTQHHTQQYAAGVPASLRKKHYAYIRHQFKDVCNHAHQLHCLSKVAVDSTGKPQRFSSPADFVNKNLQQLSQGKQAFPLDATTASSIDSLSAVRFHTAYHLPCTPGGQVGSVCPTSTFGPQTIAVVAAFDDPTVEAELATFDQQFGLPTCTIVNGCLTVVNQTGGSTLPPADVGWALEIALDIQTVHATCQTCKIILVEANSDSFSDLTTAANTAALLPGVVAVSNSYGGTDIGFSDSAYNHPGKAIVVAAGDSGAGVEYPASSPNVVAVGGTSLQLNTDNTYFDETVWSGTGSGCATGRRANSWQTAVPNWSATGCGIYRGIADVSADADPDTGVVIYSAQNGGWFLVGGTSLATPLITSIFALATSPLQGNVQALPYAHSTAFNDIVSGSNSGTTPCSSIMCSGATSYDGPTGLGTPNGTLGFGGNIAGGPTISPTNTPTATPKPTATNTPVPTNSPAPVPTNTPLPTSTPIPLSTTVVFPSIFLHGIGKAGDSVNPGSTGNLTPLHPSRTVSVSLYNGAAQLVITKTGTITYQAATGDFSGSVDLGIGFSSGTYTVKVAVPQYLVSQVVGFYQITQGQSASLPQFSMVVGDANGDNQLNLLDYNELLGCYSDLLPATNCPGDNKQATDFSDDGNVNQTDYNLFLRELSVRTGQ